MHARLTGPAGILTAMALGRHHQHLRKRMYKNLEPFPHPRFWIRFLDRTVFVVGFLSPAFTFPQLYEIYIIGNATGVSVLTWTAYAFFDIPWIVYGVVHRERAIIFAYTLWLVVNILVAVGALLY